MSGIAGFVSDKYFDSYVGDYTYDLLRKVPSAVGLNVTGYAFENFEDNGRYTLNANFKTILEIVLNHRIRDIYQAVRNCKSGIVDFLSDNYFDTYVGDYTYDLLRKVPSAVGLNVTGYAFENFEENGAYALNANFKAVMDKTLNLRIREIYTAVRGGLSGIVSFIEDKYFTMLVGDFVYDLLRKIPDPLGINVNGYAYENYEANGKYKLDDNLKWVVNETLNIPISEVYTAVRGGFDGILDLVDEHYFKLTIGMVVGSYLVDTLEASNCVVTEDENGVWTAEGAYVRIIERLFNDITIGDIYDNSDDIVGAIVYDKFGDILVGELFGYHKTEGVWYDADDEEISVRGNLPNVVFGKLYEITVAQIIDQDVDLMEIFGGVYIGDILEYELGDDGVWRKNGVAASGIEKNLVKLTINDLINSDD